MPESKISLYPKKKYIITLAILVVAFIAAETQIQLQIIKEKTGAQVVNLAGRQRMLSQKIANLVHQGKYLQADTSAEVLEKNQIYLWRGGGAQNLPPAYSPNLQQMYSDLEPLVKKIRYNTTCLSEGSCESIEKSKKEIIKATDSFLPRMDKIVFQTSDYLTEKGYLGTLYQVLLFLSFFGTLILSFFTIILPHMKKQNEKSVSLLLRKQRSDMMESTANIGSWRFDPESGKYEWSDEVYRIHGIPKETPTHRIDGLEFYAHHERDRIQRMFSIVTTSGQKQEGVFEFYSADGSHKWVRVIAAPVFDNFGKVLELTGVFQDVTEQKKKEQEALLSKQYLELAMDGTNLGIWDWYLGDNSVKFDKAWAEMLGLDHSKIKMELSTWENLVHHDDLEKCYADIEAYMSGKSEKYHNVHRMKHADGHWVYILDQGKFSEFDLEGKPTRFTGTHLDITDTIQLQKRDQLIADLRKSYIQHKSESQILFQDLISLITEYCETKSGFLVETKVSLELQKENNTCAAVGIEINEVSDEFSPHYPGAAISLPIKYSSEQIGLLVLGDRFMGYNKDYLTELEPVLSTLSEIVALHQLEVKNEAIENRTKMILQGVEMGIWNYYPKDNMLFWDDSMYKVYGVDPDKFDGHFDAWKRTLHPDDVEIAATTFNDYITEKIPEFDTAFRIINKHGEIRFIRARAQIFKNKKGQVDQVMGVNWDVTSEMNTKDELEQQKLSSQRNARLASIGVLAAGVGHEINNPLAVIKGFMTTLQDKQSAGELTPEVLTSYLERMDLAANRIAKIVKGLRTFSRSDEKIKSTFKAVTVIRETLAMVEEIYSKEGISISLVGDKSDDFNSVGIFGNYGAFQQVLMNLLSNARHAMKDSQKKNIEVLIAIKGSHHEITIRDYGTGLKPDIIDKIFDPFFTTKDVNEGTGIGLSMVHTLIEEMDGRIQARNHTGGGAEFIVTLPSREMGAQKATATVKAKSALNGRRPYSGKKALVVDDEPELRQILSTILSMMGFLVKSAPDGKEAFEILKAHPTRYDVVISDVKMPEMDGLELNRAFFKEFENQSRPVWILSTGGVNQDLSQLDKDLIVDAFFYKPFDKGDIESILAEAFAKAAEDTAA